MTTTNKYDVEVSLNLKTSRHNILYTFFYSNISEFAGNLEETLDDETCKISIQIMHKLGWKANHFKSADGTSPTTWS